MKSTGGASISLLGLIWKINQERTEKIAGENVPAVR